MTYHRETWIEIDLDAVAYNVQQAIRLNPNKTLMAVVKANAYGHGDLEVAKAALEAGAKMLAVSSFDEAMHLRHHGFTSPLLVMGITDLKDVELASEADISITAHDLAWIQALTKQPLKKELRVHLKLDSGMHRLGVIHSEEIFECYNLLTSHPVIKLAGIYTHMATADDNLAYLQAQVKKFQDELKGLDLSGIDYVHLANSATLLQFNHDFTNAIRLGISMYGVNPNEAFIPLDFKLKPTLSLYSRLSQCKKIKKGDKVTVTSEDGNIIYKT